MSDSHRHVVFDMQNQANFCRHCGAHDPVRTPMPILEKVAAMDAFNRKHGACPAPETPIEPPKPQRELPCPESALAAWPGLANWMRSGMIGVSSMAIASTITGVMLNRDWYTDTPRDADDFGRCVQLLDAVPTLRASLQQMASVSAGWANLVAEWPALEALHRSDPDDRWQQLTARIRALT